MTKNLPAELTVNVPATVNHEPQKKKSKNRKRAISNPATLYAMATAALEKSFDALGLKRSTDFADISHVEDLNALKTMEENLSSGLIQVKDQVAVKGALDSAELILKSVGRHTRILRRVRRSQVGIERAEELLAQAVHALKAGVTA